MQMFSKCPVGLNPEREELSVIEGGLAMLALEAMTMMVSRKLAGVRQANCVPEWKKEAANWLRSLVWAHHYRQPVTVPLKDCP